MNLQIDNFDLRLPPGTDPAEGERIGQEVARLVTDGLPPETARADRRIENLDLRVRFSSEDMASGRIAGAIAEQILRELKNMS